MIKRWVVVWAAGAAFCGAAAQAETAIPEVDAVSPALARKAAILEAAHKFEETVTLAAAIYPRKIETVGANYPLAFYGVTVSEAGVDTRADLHLTISDILVETATDTAGTWGLTAPGRGAAEKALANNDDGFTASYLVPTSQRYSIIALPCPPLAALETITARVASRLSLGDEYHGVTPTLTGDALYFQFDMLGEGVFTIAAWRLNKPPMFSGVFYKDEATFRAAVSSSSWAEDDDNRWNRAIAALWPWLNENVPDGDVVTVDADKLVKDYGEFMRAQMEK